MKINYNYTKYQNDGHSSKKKYSTTCDNDIFIFCIFDDIKHLLAYDKWYLPGIMSISKNELIMSFDNIEIVVSTNEQEFDFNNYSNVLYKKFEDIREGI